MILNYVTTKYQYQMALIYNW